MIKTKLISLNIVHYHCGCQTDASNLKNLEYISIEIEVQDVESEPVNRAASSRQDLYTGR